MNDHDDDSGDSTMIRERLRERLARLRALDAGSGTDGDVVDLDQQRVGRLSRMDALQAQAMAGATRQRRALESRRLEAALAREARGEYGRCLACDAPIPAGRLEVDPAATHCVACAAGAPAP